MQVLATDGFITKPILKCSLEQDALVYSVATGAIIPGVASFQDLTVVAGEATRMASQAVGFA